MFIHCSGGTAGRAVLNRVELRCTFDDDRARQVERAPGFVPFGKDVTLGSIIGGVAIHGVSGIEQTVNQHWGVPARRGPFQISSQVADLLRQFGEVAA